MIHLHAAPVYTNDGTLLDLGDLDLYAKLEIGGHLTGEIGRCSAKISFAPDALGTGVRKLMEDFAVGLEGVGYMSEIHIRSNFARIGVHAELKALNRAKDSSLITEIELYFLSKGDSGQCDLYHAMKREMERRGRDGESGLRVAQLYCVPDTAKPLTHSELEELTMGVRPVIGLPERLRFNEKFNAVELPLDGPACQIGAVDVFAAQGEAAWIRFFKKGKRKLAAAQGIISPLDFPDIENLRTPLDVRLVQIFAPADPEGLNIRVRLLRETTDPYSKHTSSQWLKINARGDARSQGAEFRHLEIVSSSPTPIKACGVSALAHLYDLSRRGATSVRVGTAPPRTDPRIRRAKQSGYDPAYSPFDHLLLRDQGRQIGSLTSLVADARVPTDRKYVGLRGVVISQKGAFLIPDDQEVSFTNWAKVYAEEDGKPVVVSRVSKINPAKAQSILNHPGMGQLQRYLGSSAAHNATHILITGAAPNPLEMDPLVHAGIGYYLHKDPSHQPIDFRTTSHFGQLGEEGRAHIYSFDLHGQARKSVGWAWVRMQEIPFYQNLDAVITIHGSYGLLKPYLDQFRLQMADFGKLLHGIRLNIGVASASAGIVRELTSLLGGYHNVSTIGVHSLHPGIEPDYRTPILMLTPQDDSGQALDALTRLGDMSIVLPGRGATRTAVNMGLLHRTRGTVFPGPMVFWDLAQDGSANRNRISFMNNANEAWSCGLMPVGESLPRLFNQELAPYIKDPLGYAISRGVPLAVIADGFNFQAVHAQRLGRNPSAIFGGVPHRLEEALRREADGAFRVAAGEEYRRGDYGWEELALLMRPDEPVLEDDAI